MIKKLFAAAMFCALTAVFQTPAKAFYPPAQNERFVIRALQQISGAQHTYISTAGNGNFGRFSDLRHFNLIDAALAGGYKNGYTFTMEIVNQSSPTNLSIFRVTATPRRYRKSGRRSFYIATDGVIRGADKNGAAATANEPQIEDYCLPNEECTVANLRTLYGAEATYQATYGNGGFGTLNQLAAGGLVNEFLARGYANGYNFTITLIAQTNNSPASFSISAVPITYGGTGFRSFYIDFQGIIHAADKQGAPATTDDPVIE